MCISGESHACTCSSLVTMVVDSAALLKDVVVSL